eukprot:TRINITY_DN46311_c0_g1_i1.p1 TRINITY_DN46311_c0_g1~~TRINITY_DN46311_c0_g1_i1.p1  ORF type:complete len:164 (-),score=35.31 TRINITY_DN46311_c0_g1_i1:93-584(-)
MGNIKMDTMMVCAKHNKFNELLCLNCKTYLCPECITLHRSSDHVPKYIHINQYVPKEIFPKIDKLITETKEKEEGIEEETKQMNSQLQAVAPHLHEVANIKLQQANVLHKLAKQLLAFSKSKPKGSYSENAKVELEKEKIKFCLLYTSPSPRDLSTSRMPSSA